jgi:hypothetical protein
MTRAFERRWGGPMRRRIRDLGGAFAPLFEDPAAFVESLGYRERSVVSLAGRAAELGAVPIPRWLMNTVLVSLRDGYRLHVFDASIAVRGGP